MKKTFLSLAVMLMVASAMTSCGSNATSEATDEGEALKVKIENCSDPDSLKIYVEQAQEYAQKLEAEGKGADAEAYLNKVMPAVETKDPSLKSYFEELKNKAKAEVKEAKEDADSIASKAVNGVKEAGENAVDAAKEKGENAVNAVKEGTQNAVNSAKEKGAEAVNATKEKGKEVAEKSKEAVEKGKEKAAEAVQNGADKVKGLFK